MPYWNSPLAGAFTVLAWVSVLGVGHFIGETEEVVRVSQSQGGGINVSSGYNGDVDDIVIPRASDYVRNRDHTLHAPSHEI